MRPTTVTGVGLGPLVAALGVALALASCSSLPSSSTPVVSEVRVQRDQVAESIKAGEAAVRARNWALAETQFKFALQSSESVDHLPGEYSALDNLGFLYYSTGKFDLAQASWEQAQDVSRLSGDTVLVARGTANRGRLAVAKGDAAAGLALIDQALASRSSLDAAVVAVILHSRALALKALDRGAEALATLEEAAKLNEGAGAYQEQASDLYVAASLLSKSGKTDEALAHLRAALALDKRAENSDGIVGDLLALATVTARLEGATNKALALDYATRAHKTALAANDAEGTAKAQKLIDELRPSK